MLAKPPPAAARDFLSFPACHPPFPLRAAAIARRPSRRRLLKRNCTKRPVSVFIGLPFIACVVQPRQSPLATAPALRHSSHLRSMSMVIVGFISHLQIDRADRPPRPPRSS